MKFPFPLLALLLAAPAAAQPYAPGQTYFGGSQYTEYRAGDLPLIICAPHGGQLAPASIPDRVPIPGQDVSTVNDANVIDLVRRIADVIFARTGRHAHLVICHLARLKLDANRELDVAAQGDPAAGAAWHDYHDFLAAARRTAQATHGFSFLVDQHGHGHPIPRLELGYNLGSAMLALADAELARPRYQWSTYFRTLPLFAPGASLPSLLRGTRSLGEFFAARGFPACPSPRDPAPNDPAFFSGGYTTDTHTGFTDNGPGHGVQIEANNAGVRDTATNRQTFAVAMAESLGQFLFDTYGFDLGTCPVFRLASPEGDLQTGGPPVEVTIARAGYRAAAETIAVSFGGSAVRNADYTAPATVAFAAGQATATLVVTPAVSSAGATGDKTIEITLAPTSLQAAAAAPLVIPLGDGRSTTVRAEVLAGRVTEGSGSAAFRLSRNTAGQPLTVNLAWTGDALAGRDYVLAPEFASSATFTVGQRHLLLDLPLVDDALRRPLRRVTLGLSPGAGYVADARTATIEIADDDTTAGLACWLPGTTSAGGFRDESGAGRHAAAQPAGRGPAVVDAPGGRGMSFNGIDQALQLPRFTLDPGGAFTLAFRFRLTPGATIANQNLVAFGSRGTAGSVQIFLSAANTLRTHLEDATGSLAASVLDVTGSLSDGAWRYYALVLDPQGGRRVFIDGALARSAVGWSGALNADEQLWLGWRPQNAAGGHLDGALADFRVYQRAISTAEVAALAMGRSTFAVWRAERGLPETSAATDDPDGDGYPNVVEYALASDPTRAASQPLLTLIRESNRTRLAFLRLTSTADVSLALEAFFPAGPDRMLATLPAGAATWTTWPGISISDTAGAVTVLDASAGTLLASPRLRVEVAGGVPPWNVGFRGAAAASGAAPSRIANLSIRAPAGSSEATLIVGFAVAGAANTGALPLLLRGVGPTLASFGVGGALTDPEIELVRNGARIAANDNWGGDATLATAFASAGAFAFASPQSRDAALLLPGLAAGNYSALVRGVGGTTGVALAELYDTTPPRDASGASPRLANVSTRAQVSAGESRLIAGFVVSGPGSKRLLIRAVGPTLSTFGVAGALPNPQLTVFRAQLAIAANDDWGGGAVLRDAFASAGAFALPPASLDAALLLVLGPGAYTVQVAGAGGGTGLALVEVYDLP